MSFLMNKKKDTEAKSLTDLQLGMKPAFSTVLVSWDSQIGST